MRAILVAILVLAAVVPVAVPAASAEHPCYVDEEGNETCTDHGPWYNFCWDPGMRKIFRLVCG